MTRENPLLLLARIGAYSIHQDGARFNIQNPLCRSQSVRRVEEAYQEKDEGKRCDQTIIDEDSFLRSIGLADVDWTHK